MLEIANVDNRPLLNYEDALLYVSLLDIDGHKDWRLPTLDEMHLLSNAIDDDMLLYNWISDAHNVDREYVMNAWGKIQISLHYWKHLVLAVRNN